MVGDHVAARLRQRQDGAVHAPDQALTGCASLVCTTEDIIGARYALVRPIFLLTKGAPAGAAKDLIDYILSAEGQKTIRDNGLIPAK